MSLYLDHTLFHSFCCKHLLQLDQPVCLSAHLGWTGPNMGRDADVDSEDEFLTGSLKPFKKKTLKPFKKKTAASKATENAGKPKPKPKAKGSMVSKRPASMVSKRPAASKSAPSLVADPNPKLVAMCPEMAGEWMAPSLVAGTPAPSLEDGVEPYDEAKAEAKAEALAMKITILHSSVRIFLT